ncbi:hypothetical protein HGM15179_021057, partial [Zosterops borbonicus]
HGPQLFRHIFLVAREGSNSRRHFRALFRLLALLSLELANDDVIVDLLRLVLALQGIFGYFGAVLLRFWVFRWRRHRRPPVPRPGAPGLANNDVIVDLLRLVLALQVIEARQKEAPFLLPEEAFGDSPR